MLILVITGYSHSCGTIIILAIITLQRSVMPRNNWLNTLNPMSLYPLGEPPTTHTPLIISKSSHSSSICRFSSCLLSSESGVDIIVWKDCWLIRRWVARDDELSSANWDSLCCWLTLQAVRREEGDRYLNFLSDSGADVVIGIVTYTSQRTEGWLPSSLLSLCLAISLSNPNWINRDWQ